MKTLSRILPLVLLLAIFGCKKKTTETSLSNVDKNLIKEIREMAVNSNNALALSLLNGEEKYDLVNQQLEYVLNEVPLNVDQKELILTLKNTLPHDAYSNFKSRQAYVVKLTEWEREITSKLGNGFVSTYLTKIIKIDNTTNGNARNAEAGGDCSYTCLSTSYLCTESSVGCGTLLLYSCDGLCYRVLA